ncbi:MAG: hypothetical protein QM761_09765 [Pseudoxanthomonas sp.]
MKSQSPLDALPELPIALFELSSKLGYSERAPIITNRPKAIKPKRRPNVAPHAPNRASHEVRTYFAWVIYPHVVCTPFVKPEAVANLRLEPGEPPTPEHAADLPAIANTRRFYKLTRFQGRPLVTPWGCEVRYGPWFATIVATAPCTDGFSDRWVLSSSVLEMQIVWDGTAADIPSVPNLTVVWDPNTPAKVTHECCPGYRWCPSSQSCLANGIRCPDLITP